MKTKTLPDLSPFCGSEIWYRHGINRKMLFTDGVKYLADEVGAYWLIDEIALCQPFHPEIANAPFQVWRLTVIGSTAVLTCSDGDKGTIYTKFIEFTDFPTPGIALWLVDNTLMLPSEY